MSRLTRTDQKCEDRTNNSTFHALTPAARLAGGSPSLAVTAASPAPRGGLAPAARRKA